MVNIIWGIFIVVGIIYGIFSGNVKTINDILISSGKTSIEIIMEMIPVLVVWMGLMEIAEKPALKELLSSGKVLKTNMTVDESRELSELTSVKEILPISGSIVLSTYFITSGFAVN